MKKIMAIILSISLSMGMWQSISGENGAISDVEKQITQNAEEQKKIVDELYKLEQEIQSSANKEMQINEQIIQYTDELNALQAQIDEENVWFDLNKEVLGNVLKIYQKRGPGTFIEILLGSDNLSDFVQRLNILKDLTKKTGSLLDTLDAIVKQLETTQEEKKEKLVSIEEEQQKLVIAINQKKKYTQEKQEFLASLLEQRVHFEEILQEMTTAWDDFKPVFTKASKGFSELAKNGSLPEDALNISFGLSGVQATLSEDAFNQAIKSNSSLPDMRFFFEEGNINIEIPEYNLVLSGNFVVKNEKMLEYKITSGEFYQVMLEQSSLDELVISGTLILDLEPLLGTNKVTAVTSELNEMILSIQISFF